MRLTSYTDYSLRTLMYLAVHRENLVTIQDIASLHNISKNHLTKVVHHLGQLGLVLTVRGRNGGLKLGWEPAEINIGEVVRQTETDFHMAECFDRDNNQCVYASACMLEDTLASATAAYLQVLDAVTLENLVRKGEGRLDNVGAQTQPLRYYPKTLAAKETAATVTPAVSPRKR